MYSSIDGCLGCLFFLNVMNNAAINVCVEVFPWTCIFSFLGYMPGVAESYGNSVFKFLRNCQIVLWGAVSFYFSTRNAWGLQFLHIFMNTVVVCVLDFSHPRGVWSDISWFYLRFPNRYRPRASSFSAYVTFLYLLGRNA